MAKNIYNNNSNTLLSGTSGNDTIWNGADYGGTDVTIDAGAGDDSIENDGSNVTISGGAGKDTILNCGDKVKISGDAGNDHIYHTFGGLFGGDDVTINGGTGDDTIRNEYGGDNLKINGGAGNDSIINGGGSKATITGGKGNDKISLDSSAKNTVIQYAEGGGNDTIRGFNSDDTLHITKGSYSTVTNGNDFIVNVDTGKIVLKNVLADKSNSISIKDSSGKVVTYNGNKVISGSIENNVRSNVTLAGSKKADTIGNSGEKVLITGQAGNDSIRNEGKFVTINAGGGNDTVGNYSGGENATIAGGAGNDSIYNEGTNSTIDVGAGNDTIKNYGYDGNHTGDYYVPHNVSITGGAGNDSIYNEGNYTTIDGGAGDDYIDNEFASGDMYEDMIPSYAEKIAGGAGKDTIKNVNEKATIGGGTDDDYISLGSDASNNVIQYAAGDGNDTIVGFNADDTLQITKGDYTTAKSGNDFIVTVGESSITFSGDGSAKINIQDSSGNVITYNDWTVWEGSIENNTKNNVTLAGSAKADTIGNSAKNVLITGKAGNDSIYNSGNNVTITGGTGKDFISLHSDAGSNVIQYAKGDGNDTIVGFNENDTLQITKGSYVTAQSGNDFIVIVGDNFITIKDVLADNKIKIADSSGNVITYNDWKVWEGSIKDNTKSDVIIIGSDEADSIGNDGKNVLITSQAGNDSIYNHFGTNATISGGAGNDSIYNGFSENATISGGVGNDSIYNDSSKNATIDGGAGDDYINSDGYDGPKGKIYGGAGNDTIQNCTRYTTISGGAGNDSIVNEYGGRNVKIYADAGDDYIISTSSSGNVTITGGKGNDYVSLGSDSKNNVIKYAIDDGNDTIFGFNSDDTLHITKGNYQTSVSGSDVIVTVGTGKITLKDAKGTKISIKDSSNKVTTNTYSSNIAELFAKDNLSEIVAEKSVGDFEYKSEKLTQENLITFAK